MQSFNEMVIERGKIERDIRSITDKPWRTVQEGEELKMLRRDLRNINARMNRAYDKPRTIPLPFLD